ncbi:multidrug ABC transporter permease [Corynebacterium lizhenjunii]|uniref:Multidrug ABC transporter permease n=1 Tax=Corynebacterium lizhenjunii TaxID=2709394 RepID=A0A7T0KCC4_9CORY|nr:ABC transporter permease [Corynebacterium lizhenjunii]QPK78171.1 multidrug ABC transporter permease [Corynebacterium lizhenjunii]
MSGYAPGTFAPGTFTPDARRASVVSIVAAQGSIESKLMLRHGEQQLLSIIIPVMILLGGTRVAPNLIGDPQELFPMVLAIAATSAGFTGQAISLAFDRRYGALKRTGASGVPAWAIIAGKVIAVLSMVALQLLVLGTVGYLVGFRTTAWGVLLAGLTLMVGVCAFTALGLALGGRLSSEVVLALSNLIWFLLLAVVGWALYSQGLGDNGWLNVVPTVALAGGLKVAFAGSFPGIQLAALAVWALAAGWAAARWFRFEG